MSIDWKGRQVLQAQEGNLRVIEIGDLRGIIEHASYRRKAKSPGMQNPIIKRLSAESTCVNMAAIQTL